MANGDTDAGQISKSQLKILSKAAAELCRLLEEHLVDSFALTKAGSEQTSSSENQ